MTTTIRKPKFRIYYFVDGWQRKWARLVPRNFDAIIKAKRDWRNLVPGMEMGATNGDAVRVYLFLQNDK